MTDESQAQNPHCPTCDKRLDTSTDYVRGHKTSDGFVCNNDDCPEGWWSFEEWDYDDREQNRIDRIAYGDE